MMSADFCSRAFDEQRLDDNQLWFDLLVWLLPCVRGWVYHAHLGSWSRQSGEIAEEIAQEAATRAFEYMQNARSNGGASVRHLNAFCRTIAHNIFVDRLREEKRMVHFSDNETLYEACLSGYERADPEEIALDHLMLEEVVVYAARVIASFPAKQRAALLAHLASSADFDAPPSPLERALTETGIQLRDYVRQPSRDAAEGGRQAALLWHACKRLKREAAVALC